MKAPLNSFALLQLTGWLFYILIQTLSFTVQGLELSKGLIISGVLGCIGVLITNVIRKVYVSKLFVGFSNYKLFFACALVSVTAAAVMTVVVYGIFTGHSMGTAKLSFDSLLDQFLTNYFQLLPLFFIWSLLYFTIKYFRKLNETTLEKVQLEASLKEARLNTLKGQINPHFLFNNLNNIRALMLEDVSAARDCLSSLAEVLRYSLTSNQRDKISLREELEIVNYFVSLGKLHYEDKLQVVQNIDDECFECLIPVMSLQILVENAIKHGISLQPNGGKLEINVSCDTDKVLMQVNNPGSISVNQKDRRLSTETGIKNVSQRLELLYGHNGSFDLSQKGNVVTALLTIPRESGL